MKRKFFAAFLSLCMVMSLVPMTALAAPEDTGTTSAPTASGTNFFANGTPITITATEPEGGTKAEFDTGFTATGNSAYISWDDNGTTKYVGVSESVSIYGGGDGRTTPVTLPSTSITMTGGKVRDVYGGNRGALNKVENNCSKITGNVNMFFSGEAKVWNLLHGGGANNTCVEGTVYMNFQNATAMNDKDSGVWPYVNGGVYGNGSEGTRNIEDGTMETFAVVNRVEITATNSSLYLVGAGGSGSTKVNNGSVELNNCTVGSLYLSGINGEVENSSIVATDCKIGSFSATNRGFVGTASVDLNGCEITEKLNFGAADGCFSSDSGTPDGSGVTGAIVWNLDAETTVKNAQLTPLVVRTGEASDPNYATTYENMTIQKEGTPLNVSVSGFAPVQKQDGTITLNTFTVPENSTLILKGVEATVASGNTITNAGTIDMDNASKLTVDSGATLAQAGTVKGTVDGMGTVTYYVARVGNTGYNSLEDALAAATDNQTVTLLEDADLKADITINKDITIDGQGQFKIDAQPKNSHAITVAPTTKLILKDVTLNITDEEGQTGTYGLNVQYGATLTLDNANVTLDGLSNATISSKPSTAGPEPGKFILKNSEITATNIGGNFSNGGDWILTNSTIEITNCASNGFSCNSATLDNSTVSVADADLMGVTAKDITLKNNSVVTVEQCGTALPKNSNWATDGISYKHPVEIKTNGKVTIDNTSSMVLQNNEKNNNTIYFVESTLENNGTLQANVVSKAPVGSFSVTVKNGTAVLDVATVTSGGTYTLPAALPNQGYNHFVGWSDGTTTYDANTQVKIEKDTTFTAVWSYTPPANPNYKITIGAMENGTVTANPTAAKAGATVTLTAIPDEGYALSTLTVTDRFGDAVRVTENANGTYTFPMPNGQVTVTATFVQVEEPAPTEPFIDVAEGDWFYDAVVYAYQNALMDGVGGNRFAPNSETTRAQLVTILYRLEGQPAVSGDLPFTDVETGTWYTDAILWAAQNGIVNGVTDTTFAPGDEITRQQLVTILYRYAQDKGYDVSASADLSGYPDADQVQDYAQPAMAWAVAEGIVEGMDGNLNPAGNASRAQIATILMRFCEDVAQ